MKQYDLFVIGTGPAGHHGAIQAAKLGKKVAVAELRTLVGGVCINTGTIPSKTLREAVLYLTGFRQRGLYGPEHELHTRISSDDLSRRVEHVIRNETGVYNAQFERNGIEILNGRASFVDAHTLRVETLDGEVLCRAANILIATGTRPACSPGVPMDGTRIFDTDAMIHLSALPRSLTIVGGGVIGVEYSCVAAALGITVTLVERRPHILDFVDGQIAEALCYHMRNQGVTLRLGEEVEDVTRTPDGKVAATLKSKKQIWSDALLYAAARMGNTDGLNLAAAGLSADDRGRLQANEHFQTAVAHIYAAGDVIGFPSLASVSMEQGRLAACHAFGHACTSAPALFPYGIYAIPEISFVGQTEEKLTEAGVPYEVGIAQYREIARGQIVGDTTGMLKLLFHRETRRLLGVHIIGEGATELIHIGQAVLAFQGTIDFFVNTVFNYPTLAECYKVAALAGINRLEFSTGAAKQNHPAAESRHDQ